MTTFIPAPLLSKRQSQLLEAIERFEAANGYKPSMREVSRVMGLAPSRIQQLASSTEAKGCLVRVPGVARSWQIVKPQPEARRPLKRK